jgi:hypothetical protein
VRRCSATAQPTTRRDHRSQRVSPRSAAPVAADQPGRPIVGGGLQEGERQPARPDGRRDPRQRQPGLLAGGGQADLLHVGLQERAGAVAGHQDAELHQPLDLGLGHAGEVGKSRCRQPLHAAVILGAVQPARRALRRLRRHLAPVVLVVVAVAQRRLRPSSSATTSTADRAVPSSAVQVRCV